MPFTVQAEVDSAKLIRFGEFADRKLRSVVQEGIEFGDKTMTSIVPRGTTSRLASAVGHSGPVAISPGHYVGTVGVNSVVAPYAEKVNVGTGIDGPFKKSVVVTRGDRSGFRGRRGRYPGAMRFIGREGTAVFRQEVKFRPSLKIQQGKNFHRKTFIIMRDWTRARVSVLTGEIALFFDK